MSTPYDEEVNPFAQDDGAFDAQSSLSTPSVERISFTPERTGSAVDSSQSTVNGGGGDYSTESSNSRALPSVPQSPTQQAPRQPAAYKNDIDRYLHSGDDADIQVSDEPRTIRPLLNSRPRS